MRKLGGSVYIKAFVLAGGLPQITLIRELKKRNIATVFGDRSENVLTCPYVDQFCQVNIFDIGTVRNVVVQEGVDFLITCCVDQMFLAVVQASEMLGLPYYLDYKIAKMVPDKELMKKVFAEDRVSTSQYVIMDELDLSRIGNSQYPLIVKPVNAYNSKEARKVRNTEELKCAFDGAVQISCIETVLVEGFLAGEETSANALMAGGTVHILCASNNEKMRDDDRSVIFRGRFPVHASPKLSTEVRKVSQQVAGAFEIKNASVLVQMITDGEQASVLEFCARTGRGIKYLLTRHSCGVDVTKAVADLTMGIKPVIEAYTPENKYIVNDLIYCRPDVFDHMEGFEEQLKEGNISDFHCLRSRGMRFNGITSSGDRVAGVTIQVDTIEEFNQEHRTFIDSVRVLDTDGNDIMRHDLLSELTV